MPYKHGEGKYICDICHREIESNLFSSRPLYDLKEIGWEMWSEEILHIEPGRMVRSEYTGGRWIKTKKKVEKVIKLKCDICIITEERAKKIRKINEKLHG